MNIFTEITANPLDVEAMTRIAARPEFGAVLVFTGIVRNHHNNKSVVAVTYDAHPSLTQGVLKQICSEASTRFGSQSALAVAHRTGRVELSEASVVIAVGSPHRDEAYEISRYILEEIKTRLPVWKKEHYENGDSEWLPGHSLNSKAR